MAQQEQALGPHLGKATWDEFTYAVGMRDGTVYRCGFVKEYGEWLQLVGGGCWGLTHYPDAVLRFAPGAWPGPEQDAGSGDRMVLCRGVQVRLADVAWVADAPEGS